MKSTKSFPCSIEKEMRFWSVRLLSLDQIVAGDTEYVGERPDFDIGDISLVGLYAGDDIFIHVIARKLKLAR